MVAQYFKRKREFVEIFIVSGSGLGIVCMSTFIKSAIEAIGWRLVPSTFAFVCYHVSSPQTRAASGYSLRLQHVHSGNLLPVGVALPPPAARHPTLEEPEAKD